MIYLFDIDGTLTPSRKAMDPDFYHEFLEFCNTHHVYLVTGSDYPKALEQVGEGVLRAVHGTFCCSGNHLVGPDLETVYINNWVLPEGLVETLERIVEDSEFPHKTGNHIEIRPGSINFSVLGRGPDSMKYREEYKKWDEEHLERYRIQLNLLEEQPNGWELFNGEPCDTSQNFEVGIGGETGLDIYPLGKDKGQVVPYLQDLFPDELFTFFGDKMENGGNDEPLANELSYEDGDETIQVSHWEETRSIIRTLE